MRDWARVSMDTHKAVEKVDTRRIKALSDAFKNLGYSKQEAFIRASILYFHQVGYYAMNIKESYDRRLEFIPHYFKKLTGFDLPDSAL